MDKKELIEFILNDIKELELIAKGMHEMDRIPGVMQKLAITKTQSILNRFYRLEEPQLEEPQLEEPQLEEPFPKEEISLEEKESTIIADEIIADEIVSEEVKVQVRERTTNEKFQSRNPSVNNTVVSTNKRAEDRFIQNLRKAINLNDRYRYKKELFGGDLELMNSVIDKLDAMTSLESATDYLRKEFAWDTESETVTDFYLLLEGRFS